MAAGEVWLKIYLSSRVKLGSSAFGALPGAVLELIMAKKGAELTVPVQALGEQTPSTGGKERRNLGAVTT